MTALAFYVSCVLFALAKFASQVGNKLQNCNYLVNLTNFVSILMICMAMEELPFKF